MVVLGSDIPPRLPCQGRCRHAPAQLITNTRATRSSDCWWPATNTYPNKLLALRVEPSTTLRCAHAATHVAAPPLTRDPAAPWPNRTCARVKCTPCCPPSRTHQPSKMRRSPPPHTRAPTTEALSLHTHTPPKVGGREPANYMLEPGHVEGGLVDVGRSCGWGRSRPEHRLMLCVARHPGHGSTCRLAFLTMTSRGLFREPH